MATTFNENNTIELMIRTNTSSQISGYTLEGGKRLDIVLLINVFPIAVGELKTPVRSAIT